MTTKTTVKLPDLPYDQDALQPHISAETLALHHGKHHKGYVDKTNKLIEGTSLENQKLVDIISQARERAAIPLLNNAQQSWNHTFLWESMTPDGPIGPQGRIAELVRETWGGNDRFKKEFKQSATAQFGSGWTWLVMDGAKLKIMSTSNADSPVATHLTPLLTLDVWEHAYYVDYRNERAKYVDVFLDHLINWKFAAQNLESLSQAA
jgi:Fe-Mn family superoxide dismutase